MKVKQITKNKIISKTVDIPVPIKLPEIVVYTDGGASPNPGKGGYGVLIYIKDQDVIELSQGFGLTTNNRMEIMAVVVAMEKIEEMGIDGDVIIYSDSQNTINAINSWVLGWYKNKWRKKDGSRVSNLDLWKRYMNVLLCRFRRGGQVSGIWIKGHDGHLQNERCDLMARIAMYSDDLVEDEGYTPVDGSMSFERPLRFKYSYSRRDYKRDDRSSNGYRKTYDYRDRYTSL